MKLKHFFSKIRNSWNSPSITLAIFKSAYFIGILLYCIAIAQLFITLSLPLEVRSDRYDVYLRNCTSIIAFALTAQFLLSWCAFNVKALTSQRQIRWFGILTFAAGVVSLFKGLVSIYFLYNQMHRGASVSIYYASDVVGWIAIAIFFFAYWNLKTSRNTPLKWFTPNFKKLTNILVYFFVYKAAASSYYTAMRYNHYGYAWTFFLSDAIAWLLLAAFFAAYTRSKLVSMKMNKGHKHNEEIDDLCNQTARHHHKRRKFYRIGKTY